MDYRGVLYAGIMLTKDGPKTLEFNVRFGDPETQAILPRLKSDIVEVMLAVAEGRLSVYSDLEWEPKACVCVVCASAGYPGEYQANKEIFCLRDAALLTDTVVFHAGTKKENNRILASGGRVLGVTGCGVTIKEAIGRTYQAVEKIKFEGMHYRKDIGYKAINTRP